MKYNSNTSSLDQIKVRISSKVRDHSKDPYVVKKVEASKATLEKYGFPAELLRLQAEKQAKMKL